ncbi:MAG: ATP-binding protein [Candidatus Aenigmatarchaeota archaeon]
MREILERQKTEAKEILSKEIIPRENIKNIEKYIEKPLIKVITGIRRSGKSLLALLLIKDKNYGYVNFDEKELSTIKLDDLLNYLKEVFGDFKFLLLDEIQNIDGWELWVNSLQRRGYNVLITGSNAKLLSKELATHLTGRYVEFENFPFSFREFLVFKKFDTNNLLFLKEKQGLIKNLLMEYLERGGFPEYLVHNLDKNYLETLFHSIIYKDVVKRWNIKYPRKIDDLAKYIISNYSSQYTFTKLKNSLNFRSVLTVENYMKYLEEAYLIFSLERFSFKVKEMKKSPKKVYCIDTGIINAISVKFSKEIGKLMENLVFLELKRKGLKENFSIFYGQFNNNEVDFLIKNGLEIKQLIQVTYASSKDEIEKREIKALLKASELLKCENLLIITWDYEDELKVNNKKIKCIPLWKWLLS